MLNRSLLNFPVPHTMNTQLINIRPVTEDPNRSEYHAYRSCQEFLATHGSHLSGDDGRSSTYLASPEVLIEFLREKQCGKAVLSLQVLTVAPPDMQLLPPDATES